MKVSTACLCLLLTEAVLIKQMLALPASVSIPTSCCFSMSEKISFKRLHNYTIINNSRCSQEAVIFKTKRGKDVCADPKEKWVQNAMKHLDRKLTKPKSSKSSRLN